MISNDIHEAVRLIESGDVIGFPTETVYGLAASIRSSKALRKVFEMKERPFFDPLIVHIHDLGQKDEVISSWPQRAEILAEAFWPGPLTLVLPKSPSLDPLITAGLSSVGLRMPSHPVARELLRQVKVPLAAPSANKFGKVSPTRPEHVIEELGDNLFVLDGGSSECGVESTVVRLQDRMIEILRPGLVTEEKISEVLKLKGEKFQISYARSQASPGHLESHYEPKRPLLILNENEDPKKAAERFQISSSRGMELELPSDAFLAARLLYASLRELSESSVDFIFVRRTPERSGGAWRAIWDRLERASRRGGSGSSA